MLLTVAEVAARLRLSRTFVYQLINSGRLKACRFGVKGGAIRVLEEDLTAYTEDSRETGNAGASLPSRPVRLKHLTQ